MYIKLSTLGLIILATLGAAVLVCLIILLRKLTALIDKVNVFWDSNEKHISNVVEDLPKTAHNLSELSDNLKVVSEVVTETAASAIETKEHVSEYFTIARDIISIIRKIFAK